VKQQSVVFCKTLERYGVDSTALLEFLTQEVSARALYIPDAPDRCEATSNSLPGEATATRPKAQMGRERARACTPLSRS
jgi:hypothetical protein